MAGRDTDTIESVSLNKGGLHPTISADGRYVAFYSFASDLVAGDTNSASDIFVYDRDSDTIERVSQGNGGSYYPVISADGRHVSFWSDATDLVAGDTNGKADVFVYDRVNHTTERVSVDNSGDEGGNGSLTPAISADGRYVTFESLAADLVAADTNGARTSLSSTGRDPPLPTPTPTSRSTSASSRP